MKNKKLRLVGYKSTDGYISGDVHIIKYSGKGDYYHIGSNSKTLCGKNVHELYVEVLSRCLTMENASCEKCLQNNNGGEGTNINDTSRN